MITEIILGIIVLALIGYIVWKDKHYGQERRELLNAVLSKTSIEFATANKIGESVDEKKKEELPDIIDQDQLDQKEFEESIKKTNED